ncbi:MAG: D-2-hydroxyacid dehydrogenase [Muribaculaceae bacterium]|nr:D-2-hydroxyacid dehydrogenase [Muribaculaceae bacterium]
MKITVLDGYGLNPGDLSWEGLAELGELTVYDRTAPTDIYERSKDSEILLTNKTRLDADTIARLPKLRYIGVLATGYNVVDTEAAKTHGVTVTNIPAYSTMSVAQQVFALILAITNKVEHYAEENHAGRWSRNQDFCYWDTPLTELAGKTIGIVGLGNIGKAVARIALAFGMRVIACTSKKQEELPEGIEKKELRELFAESDVLTLHCPLTPETEKMVNTSTLSLMRPTAILINTGRGPLIDEGAVAESLRTGRLGAFGADVLSSEPPAADNPLLTAPNSYITPHIAWASKEARERLMGIAVNNVSAFLEGKAENVVKS